MKIGVENEVHPSDFYEERELEYKQMASGHYNTEDDDEEGDD